MVRSFLVALGLFFIQPAFLAGLGIAIWSSQRRVRYERQFMRTAIYRDSVELMRYLLWGIPIGIGLSLVSVLVGMPVTLDWIVLYQLITLLSFGLGLRFIHPMFTFSLTSLLLLGASLVLPEGAVPFLPENWHSPLTSGAGTALAMSQSVLILGVLLIISSIIQLPKNEKNRYSPRFMVSKRGKVVARFRMTPFWVAPLLLVVPGKSFGALFDWWPFFSIGNQTFSFFLLPVLMGLRYTVQAQLPSEATKKLVQEFMWVAIGGILAFAASIWFVHAAWIGLLLLMVGGFTVLYRHRLRERKWTFQFGPAERGVRVIAVRPGTPAEKMELSIGDTILTCNNKEIDDSDDFYQALAENRVYCHLRIKRPDGEIRLAETAIYDDSPHDLGIVILSDVSYA